LNIHIRLIAGYEAGCEHPAERPDFGRPCRPLGRMHRQSSQEPGSLGSADCLAKLLIVVARHLSGRAQYLSSPSPRVRTEFLPRPLCKRLEQRAGRAKDERTAWAQEDASSSRRHPGYDFRAYAIGLARLIRIVHNPHATEAADDAVPDGFVLASQSLRG